jgi:hypothetical protein
VHVGVHYVATYLFIYLFMHVQELQIPPLVYNMMFVSWIIKLSGTHSTGRLQCKNPFYLFQYSWCWTRHKTIFEQFKSTTSLVFFQRIH